MLISEERILIPREKVGPVIGSTRYARKFEMDSGPWSFHTLCLRAIGRIRVQSEANCRIEWKEEKCAMRLRTSSGRSRRFGIAALVCGNWDRRCNCARLKSQIRESQKWKEPRNTRAFIISLPRSGEASENERQLLGDRRGANLLHMLEEKVRVVFLSSLAFNLRPEKRSSPPLPAKTWELDRVT